MALTLHRNIALLFILLAGIPGRSSGQADTGSTGKNFGRDFSIGLQHGFIFAHSEAVQNTRGANPTGLELALGWQRGDATAWELCRCYPRKGILLAYYDYDTRILGKSVTAAWFLEPQYRLGKGWLFSIRAVAGASYLSNPFDSLRNPGNMSYSSRLSGYLLIGTGVWIRLSDHWWVHPGINYQHVSNGGSRQPNKGINWPTAGLSFSYRKKPQRFYRGSRKDTLAWKGRPPGVGLVVFGNALREVDTGGRSRRVALLGLGMQYARAVGRISNLALSTEIYYDMATRRRLQRDSINASAMKIQFAAGHQWVLGRFLFSQWLGVYLFDQTPYNDILFHRWELHYQLGRRWSLGISLQAHRQVAEFTNLRITRRFGR